MKNLNKLILVTLICLLPIKSSAEVSQDRIQYELAEGQRISNAIILADVAWCEASTQGNVGKLAVMDVVLNRVVDTRFPNSIELVVHHPWAFECITKNVPITRNSPTYRKSLELAFLRLSGQTPRITHATHYYNPTKANPFWAKSPQMAYLGDIGAHSFYIGF